MAININMVDKIGGSIENGNWQVFRTQKKFFSNLFFPIFAQQISTIFEEHIKHFNLMKINS